MDYKKLVKTLLQELKEGGHDRFVIEKKLGYVENGITQSLSRGGDQLHKLYSLLLLYKKAELNNSMSDSTESIMREESVQYGAPVGLLLKQQNKLMITLTRQSHISNGILKKLSDNLEVKIDILNTNLTDALGRVDSLKFDLFSGRQVALESLARLEGKPDTYLLKKADSIVASLLVLQKQKRGKSAGNGK